MKRIVMLLLALALLLSGCGGEPQAPQTEPYELEVEYGDSGIAASRGSFFWQTAETETEAETEPPFDRLSEIPFVNESKAKELKLLFPVKPDALEIRGWTSEDGYQQPQPVQVSKNKLPVPTDGASWLFEVQASWEQGKKTASWGSCTYYFRYLPQTATGDQSRETLFYKLVQLEPGDLFGAEFTNYLDLETRTCKSEQDLTAILDFLKDNLSTNFREIEQPDDESDYGLRLAATDGTQYVFSYGGQGKSAWLAMDGKVWEAGVMDLYSLWKSLEAPAVSLDNSWQDAYLQISETFPGDAWEDPFAYGYLRTLDSTVVYEEMKWVPDEENPDQGTLERGQLGVEKPVAEDCQYWILKDHAGPWCQVGQSQLLQLGQEAGYDVLYRLYTREDRVVAITEQLLP